MYTIYPNGFIQRIADGAWIPADLLNADRVAYLAWVAAGNTATPAVIIVLSADEKAAVYADSIEKVQFRLLFNMENRIRALEGKAAITLAVYRQAVIDLWKQLNP